MKIKPKIQESKPKIQSKPEIQTKARATGKKNLLLTPKAKHM
jgi:hypothetical protein